MKKLLNMPAVIVTLLLSVALQYLMSVNEVELSSRIIGAILFFAAHYFVLILLMRALKALYSVLRLPELNVKSYAYRLYPVALLILYIAFLLVMGRLAEYYMSAYQLAGIIVAGIIALIIAQLGGAIPDRLFTQKKRAIRLENAGGALGGFEILGSLIGTYRDGVVLGVDAIPYKSLDRMHRSKDSIIIEGSVDPKVELIVVSEKAQDFFIAVLAERLNVPRGGLDSVQSQKHKSTLDRLKDHKVTPQKQGQLRRAKPVKLIEQQKALGGKKAVDMKKPVDGKKAVEVKKPVDGKKAVDVKKAAATAKTQAASRAGDAQGKPGV